MNTLNFQQPPSLSDWVTPTALCEEYPQFREEQIQWLLRIRDRNGLAVHVRKIGRKLYLSKSGFARWVAERPAA